MKAPFFKVYIDGSNEEITDYIESFSYEDCMKEDSFLNLSVYAKFAMALADDPRIKVGTNLSFQFGYLGGKISKLHRIRVTDITHKYNERITMDIKCLDVGNVARKVESSKVWKDVTTQEIVVAIANKYGLEVDTDNPQTYWDNLPQGNKSDTAFLEELAGKEDGGDWVSYIRNKTLYFVHRKLDSNAVISYTYGDGDGVVISFEPSQKESTKGNGASNGAQATAVDPKTGNIKSVLTNNTNELNKMDLSRYERNIKYDRFKEQTHRGKTGTYTAVKSGIKGNLEQATKKRNDLLIERQKECDKIKDGVKPDAAKIKQIDEQLTGISKQFDNYPDIKKKFVEPYPKGDNPTRQMQSSTSAAKKSSDLGGLKATLTIEGNPLLVPNTVITMKGVAKVHSGNWFVEKVTHDVSTSGYTCSVELAKTGSNVGTKKSEATNKSKGPETQEEKIAVRVVGSNFSRTEASVIGKATVTRTTTTDKDGNKKVTETRKWN